MSKKILFAILFNLLIFNSFGQILIKQSKPLPNLCTGAILSSNGQFAYITNINGELSIIDLVSMNVTKTIKNMKVLLNLSLWTIIIDYIQLVEIK
jgi:DNA-binding beta-propeller fold protein YncE